MRLEKIAFLLREMRFEFSRHAFERAAKRNITDAEIWQAAAQLELIEEYPHDKYSPSCLVLGFTETGRPLHLQVCYTGVGIKIITLYEPEPELWSNCRTRRRA